jgi:tRNA A37 threonylcarbamoyladenosine biosynthesis protein TsaE
MLIEWPERVPTLRGQADLSIRLDFDGDGRQAEITPMTERAGGLCLNLAGFAAPGPVVS